MHMPSKKLIVAAGLVRILGLGAVGCSVETKTETTTTENGQTKTETTTTKTENGSTTTETTTTTSSTSSAE